MKKSYSLKEKEQIIKQYETGTSITSIHQVTGIARSTLYKWVNEYNASTNSKKH